MSAVSASRARSALRTLALLIGASLSSALTMALIGATARSVSGNRMAPWIIGRASGICAYLLLVTLVLTGLVLAHPWRARVRRPSTATRLRIHASLAAFTAAFVALHIVVLATDRYAGVGWWGALVPMGAQYRPVATTLGVVGLWCGLLAGLTAAAAGRLPRGVWWPIHKIAAVALALVWVHAVLGGGDTTALLPMYLATAALVVGVALTRYAARTPRDRVAELTR